MMEDFRQNLYLTLFDDTEAGDIIPIVLKRGREILSIQWTFPGFTNSALFERTLSQWWLAYAFWLVGTLTFLLVRPKNTRWKLMVAFNYLTSLWLAAGPGPSSMHIWGALVVVRASLWLSVPVYMHLHWIFPSPLRVIPSIALKMFYTISVVLAISEILQMLRGTSYQYAFLVAMFASIIFLFLQFWLKKEQRANIRLILIAAAIAFAPPMVFGIALPDSVVSTFIRNSSIFFLPALPAAYFYAAYRRQLGGLELRANRLISIYLFIILLGTTLLIVIPFAHASFTFPSAPVVIDLVSTLLTAILVIVAFNPFQRFVERRILGIPQPPTYLIQDYAAKITTSLSPENLVSLIEENILPSLLIRQSALITIPENMPHSVLYFQGLTRDQLPRDNDISTLVLKASKYLPPDSDEESLAATQWIRLILPLYSDKKLVGLWLLGRRDPDDYYDQAEIEILSSLANQTAIALTNIRQAEQLRSLYQANIDRHEGERTRLAHDLHDVVLNQLGSMFTTLEDEKVVIMIGDQLQSMTNHLRQIIQDLRPAMLDYGLLSAIHELSDNLNDRPGNKTQVNVDIPSTTVRLNKSVELHIFRIVQQACENAYRHANATNLKIHGEIKTDSIYVIIEDNGDGFEVQPDHNLVHLLEKNHFGLASMIERAALIQATIEISSEPTSGTRVTISWNDN